MRTIKARINNGVIEPMEELDVADGVEVFVTILEVPYFTEEESPFLDSAGGWVGLVDAEELKRDIYADRLISTRGEPGD